MVARTLGCLLIAFSTVVGAQQPPPAPLHKDQIAAMVRDGLADDSGAKLVKARGIDFTPDPDFAASLRKAGATEAFIEAVQEAAHPGAAPAASQALTRVQVTALIEAGIASSRVAMLVNERGIDFEPTDDYLHQLRAEGAGPDVVDALKAAERTKPAASTSVPVPQANTSKSTPPPVATPPVPRIRMGGAVEASRLIYEEAPQYPPLAKMARIQGIVRLEVVIGKDGTVQEVKVLSGHPLLIESALLAVSKWRYRPTLVNGEPVEVVSEVAVNFQLTR